MHERTAGLIGAGKGIAAGNYFVNTFDPNKPNENLWNVNLYQTPAAKELTSDGLTLKDVLDQINSLMNASAEAATGIDFGDDYEKSGGIPFSNYGSGSGSGYSGPSADARLQAQTMQDYINMIQKTTDANNAWAAEQAQKQMDFQERMARNAHQYEIEDLKKAGLNPVLSASGGNGSSSASGAMAQPDTTNSNLVAQMALQAVDSLGSSAIQVANGYNSKASNSFKNSLLGIAAKYFVPTLARGAAKALTKGLF